DAGVRQHQSSGDHDRRKGLGPDPTGHTAALTAAYEIPAACRRDLGFLPDSACAIWAGVSTTMTPAASSAPRFDPWPPRLPVTMAPAWPIFLPGGEAAPAMKAATGLRIVLA